MDDLRGVDLEALAEREAIGRECEPQPPVVPSVPPGGGGAGAGGRGYIVPSVADLIAEQDRAAAASLTHLLGARLAGATEDTWRGLLTTGRRDAVENTIGNAVLILTFDRRVLPEPPRYNQQTLFCESAGHVIDDAALTGLRVNIESVYGFAPSEQIMAAALLLVGKRNGYHPVRQYLSKLRWDGIPRIHDVAYELLGVPRSHRLAGRYLWCFLGGAVSRALRPGCQHHTVLTLVGEQGAGKSTFFRVLGGPFFNESKIDVGEKDGALKTHAAWIHELPEVEQVTLFREASAVKSFITQATDTLRAPYERVTSTRPRCSIFGATTNQEDFLRDESGSGSRRWHPLHVGVIDGERLAAIRDQLWAEALARVLAGEPTHLTRDEEREREEISAQHYQVDPWDAAISRWIDRAPEVQKLPGLGRFFVSTRDLLVEALRFPVQHCGVGESRRIGGLMRRRGWLPRKARVQVGSGLARRQSREPENGWLAPEGWEPAHGTADASSGDPFDMPV